MQNLTAEVNFLRQENTFLKFEIAELKRLIYGSKSERFIPSDPSQGILPLPGLETQPEQPVNNAAVETETITRKKKTSSPDTVLPVRSPIPAHIPRRTIEILPEGIDLEKSKKIGEEITEYLELDPGKIYVKQIIRPKYKLEDGSIKIASLPAQPLPRSNVGAGLLAHILVSKFVDHLPLYRQRKQFLRDGVDIAQSTINDWMRGGCQLLVPLYDTLSREVKEGSYTMADETPMPVLNSEKQGSTHKGYMWAYYAPELKLQCFEYHKSRGREGPQAFLEEFKGYLQTDGYSVYNEFEGKEGITLLSCMAHARRYFEHSLDNDRQRAEHALKLIGKLYVTERKAREKGMDANERLALREKESVEVLKELETWLKQQAFLVLPKSSIGKAIAYSLKLWHRLIVFTTDGRLEIDNNLVENKIRPIALGRKNYLFAGSHESAQRIAMIYSFFATCQLHDVNPHLWLTDILNRIGEHNIQNLAELLPHNWKVSHQHSQP